jgi:hypothetical protein
MIDNNSFDYNLDALKEGAKYNKFTSYSEIEQTLKNTEDDEYQDYIPTVREKAARKYRRYLLSKLFSESERW